jgi:carboxyl-terminal processing protease
VSVDGQPVERLVDRGEAADPRTRRLEHWRRVNRALHGAEGSRVSLRVRGPDGRERDVTATRTLGRGEIVTLGNLVLRVAFENREARTPAGRRAGVIAFSVWMASVNEPIAAAVDRFRQHDGIVIDLRGNPGGLAAMMSGVAGHFIAEPVVLGTMRTRQAALAFKANPRLVTADGRAVTVFDGPVAILVDELTGSTSETFAGSMQSLGRARVFGRQTMGQALPALTKRLATGDVLMYAIGDFTTAGGRSLEGAGVIPDVTVPLSLGALSAGRDDVLEAALRWLDTGKSRP